MVVVVVYLSSPLSFLFFSFTSFRCIFLALLALPCLFPHHLVYFLVSIPLFFCPVYMGFNFRFRGSILFSSVVFFFSWVYGTCCVLRWQVSYIELLIDAGTSLDDVLLWFCGGIDFKLR